ncbi:hypothetical protein GPX89_15160 [Nocardia sp. ET3-3]|uniref:DUF6194 domain-containing protein n=1 Tax=Nocardia terrae TaxID=2675851 RepID=A0A7K1UWB5_9NOCA|nr:DUF6194 family protein [Nocardia terrae]MVU78582.1 hypothetical protein [Nocardia terrae]
MEIDEITEYIESLGGVLTLAPGPDSGFPEIAWGDKFFYYAPDGQIPTRTQPFATIVTKNYPDDTTSDLDRPDVFRLNINPGRDAFLTHLGYPPRNTADHPVDASKPDTWIPHPVYASAGWVAVVAPGDGTESTAKELLTRAHSRARSNYDRHAD